MAARSAVLVLNHFKDRYLFERYVEIEQECGQERDVFLLSDRTRRSLTLARQPERVKEFRFKLDDLVDLGYPGKKDIALPGTGMRHLKLGNAELSVLLFYASHDHYEHYWIVEYDVRFSGPWRDLFSAFDTNDAALLGTSLIRYPEFPGWSHWPSLAIPSIDFREEDRLRGFFPVYRVSNSALACMHEVYRKGCTGHMETLMPTLLNASGLRVEDIGGDGHFVKPQNINRFYDNQRATNELSPGTFVFRPVRTAPGSAPNRLWHPVKPKVPFVSRMAGRLWRELSSRN